MNRPGEFAVALGKTRCADGLQLVNFKIGCCTPSPQSVREHYEQNDTLANMASVFTDHTCCKTSFVTSFNNYKNVSQSIENYEDSDEESELEEDTDFLETIQELTAETKETLLKEMPTTTQRQLKIANIIKETDANNMAIFIEKIQTKLSTVINFNDKGSQRFQITLNSWYSNTSKLMTSKWLKTNIKRLFNNTPITNEHYIAAWKIFDKLRLN